MPIVYPNGSATVAVAASDKVAIYSDGRATLSQIVGYPQMPDSVDLIAQISSGRYTSSAFSAAGNVLIEAGASPVIYEVGTAAIVQRKSGRQSYQENTAVVNATATISAAQLLTGIITSTTAAAVAGTVPTGALLDAASDFSFGDAIEWSVINTGPNAFTVTASTGHSLVGNAVVAAGKAGRFMTRKVDAATFITYSLANT